MMTQAYHPTITAIKFDNALIGKFDEITSKLAEIANATGKKLEEVRKLYFEWVNIQNAGPGRPRMEVDPGLVERLASIGCTHREIAFGCDCSEDTIERHYLEQVERGKAFKNISLRRKLFKKSLDDENVSCLIFALKNEAGMRDGMLLEHSNPDGSMAPKIDFKSLPEELKQQLVSWIQNKI